MGPEALPAGGTICVTGRSTAVRPGPAAATLTSVTEDGVARRERRRAEARQRAKELSERIAELAKRRGEIDVEISEIRGSGVEQVRVARENIDRARQAAVVAAELAATAAECSADVRDRAASLLEQLAEDAHGDPDEHLFRAAEHRRAARDDREVAKNLRAEVAWGGGATLAVAVGDGPIVLQSDSRSLRPDRATDSGPHLVRRTAAGVLQQCLTSEGIAAGERRSAQVDHAAILIS